MSERPWDGTLPAGDRLVETVAPAAERLLAGEPPPPGADPAVLAIDLQRHLLGPDVPTLEAVETYETATGSVGHAALDHVEALLATARDAGVPVYYTRVVPGPKSGLGPPDIAIHERVSPSPADEVVDKPYSSAFYATDLVGRLVRRGVDTVVVLGCSTSGCVRATAVDAAQHGFGVLVPTECTFDRIRASHQLGLYEIDRSYGRVASRGAVETYLETGTIP